MLVFGVNVFDLNLGSKLILSNNKSRTTLWVLETCLIERLLSFMIILITASLSSNTYNKASWCENWTFDGTASMSFITSILLWGLWCLWTSLSSFSDPPETRETFPRTETIRSHSSRAGNPSNLSPVSKEMIQILLNCEKQQFVSCTSNLWEQTYGFRKCTMFHLKWILSPQDLPAKTESWNCPNLHCFAVFPTWQYCLYSLVYWM